MTARILLIEDEAAVGLAIGELLTAHALAFDWAQDGLQGLSLGVRNTYDLIILDLHLPSLSGLEICRKLREQARVTIPILMLTAQSELDGRLEGFEAGADDYLCKPFEARELLARIRALLRRADMRVMPSTLSVGDLTYDLATVQIRRAGKEIHLPDKARQLLLHLMRASPRPVSREALVDHLWGHDASVDAFSALRQHLHHLRAAVDHPFAFPMIRNVPKSQVALLAEDPWREH
ncbi:response regulator transcription factor [Pseudoxanthomonas composti]|uniref:Response regulator transcription factor n=1 Tax=Pseudoxanthomonas composti TaxID=2137479 RepID=A0A4Q1JT82_9GAMM|nr:response regulator transcription factor [Pseudoxanthomonas composti]RXQ99935.1 response regulator transcription factor [Pseudoxanthomonas composti]